MIPDDESELPDRVCNEYLGAGLPCPFGQHVASGEPVAHPGSVPLTPPGDLADRTPLSDTGGVRDHVVEVLCAAVDDDRLAVA